MKKIIILFVFVSLGLISNAQQIEQELEGVRHQRSDGYVRPTDRLVLNKLDKWQDLKYGVMFHWGLYTVPGIMESWNMCGEDYDWIRRPTDMTYEQYKSWYWGLKDYFNPMKFNPERWAAIMKDGGMKYVIFTTKHHDGFCMFDTKQTDFSVMNSMFKDNPRANVTKYIFDAFRKENFMIGAYYSKPDWHSDYYWWRRYPTANRNVNYNIKKYPEQWNKFKQFTFNQIQELMTGYGDIDILWLDGGWVNPQNNQDISMDKIAAMARKNQPGLMVVDRTVKGEFENYQTPEGVIPATQLDVPFEVCMPMKAWGWRYTGKYKSAKKMLSMLIEVVAKGGNFVLAVGPTPEGTIDDEATEIIESIGKWLDVNGKSIYKTCSAKHYNDGNVWFTMDKNKHTMYALYALPDKEESVPDVIEWTTNIPRKGSVLLLQNGKRIRCDVKGNQVKVCLPKNIDRKHSLAFEFDIK